MPKKVTDHDKELIRALVAERRHLLDKAAMISNSKLAQKFNVSKAYIDKIGSYDR